MPLLAKDKGGADFDPIPAGMHHAVCYGVVDLGTQKNANPQFPPRRKVRFLFELPGERIDVMKDGILKNLARATSAAYTLSLAAKGNLRPMLQSWRGRAFTQQELDGFDVFTVLGANCFLNMIHEEKVTPHGKKIYSNIGNINPVPKGTGKVAAENPLLKFSLDDFPGGIVFPENMPEWLQEIVMESEEYVDRSKGASSHQGDEGVAAGHQGPDENVPF